MFETTKLSFTCAIFSEMNKDTNDEISQEEFRALCLADDNFRSLVMSFWPEKVKDVITKKI